MLSGNRPCPFVTSCRTRGISGQELQREPRIPYQPESYASAHFAPDSALFRTRFAPHGVYGGRLTCLAPDKQRVRAKSGAGQAASRRSMATGAASWLFAREIVDADSLWLGGLGG